MVTTAIKEATISNGADEATKEILDYLVKLPRKTGELEVDAIADGMAKHGKPVYYYDVVATLKQMEQANMGRFIVGRRGGTSRFLWGAPGKRTARATHHIRKTRQGHGRGKVTVTITLPMNSPLLAQLMEAVT